MFCDAGLEPGSAIPSFTDGPPPMMTFESAPTHRRLRIEGCEPSTASEFMASQVNPLTDERSVELSLKKVIFPSMTEQSIPASVHSMIK